MVREQAETKLQHAIKGLFGGRKKTEHRRAQTEAEKARETEQQIAAGIAANKFPPR
jgi:hypothetical protein